MENKNSFSLMFFAIGSRANENGEIPLHLRITVNNRKVEMSLHRRVDKSIWNPSAGMAMGNTKNAKIINSFLMSVQTTVYEHFKYLRETGRPITAEALRNAYLGIEEEEKGPKVLELFKEHNDKLRLLEGIDYAPLTIERYETSYKHTQDYIRAKYNKDDLFLSELDFDFINGYELYLKTVRRCAHNTTLKYLKNFKKIINIAIASGDLNRDPFINFKMKLKKVDRGFLSEEELQKIINKKFDNERLCEVRDCFLFSCFTGLAYSDLAQLTYENIVTGTDGGQWIKIKRQKTDNLSSIPIIPATQKLIDKYSNHPYCKLKNILMPVKTNQKMNSYLKEIGDVCGINKHMSSHLARHTFATTVTLNNNVPIETVSKMLGHSSLDMTRIYARLLDKKVGQDMKQLAGKYDIEV